MNLTDNASYSWSENAQERLSSQNTTTQWLKDGKCFYTFMHKVCIYLDVGVYKKYFDGGQSPTKSATKAVTIYTR